MHNLPINLLSYRYGTYLTNLVHGKPDTIVNKMLLRDPVGSGLVRGAGSVIIC
jgi:hypothetical protein